MIQEAINKLERLGRMPDESNENLSSEEIDEYGRLIKEVIKPISLEDARVLIKLFPERGLYGVEWTLLHIFESVLVNISVDDYERIIKECPSEEWRNTLKTRLDNKLQQ